MTRGDKKDKRGAMRRCKKVARGDKRGQEGTRGEQSRCRKATRREEGEKVKMGQGENSSDNEFYQIYPSMQVGAPGWLQPV